MQNDELKAALKNTSDTSHINAPAPVPTKKQVNQTRRTFLACLGTGAVCTTLGFMTGGFLGRSGALAEVNAEKPVEVTSVKAKSDVFEQLQDMRESTIKSLQTQLGSLANSNKSSSSESAAVSMAAGWLQANTQSVSNVLTELVKGDVDCDTLQKCIDGTHEDKSAAVIAALGDKVPHAGQDQKISTKFFGGSPYSQLKNIHCEVVSSPTLSVVAVEGVGGNNSTLKSLTYAAFVPIASADSKLYTAVYVVNTASSGQINSVGFAGLIQIDNVGTLMSQIAQSLPTS